jgi:hypothetical protein
MAQDQTSKPQKPASSDTSQSEKANEYAPREGESLQEWLERQPPGGKLTVTLPPKDGEPSDH